MEDHQSAVLSEMRGGTRKDKSGAVEVAFSVISAYFRPDHLSASIRLVGAICNQEVAQTCGMVSLKRALVSFAALLADDAYWTWVRCMTDTSTTP